MELIVETSLLDDVKLKDDITEAQETAEEAYTTATKAVSIAGNNDQYFWTSQTGTDTGAHITLVSQETFKANPRGANLLARNNGVAIRDGLLEIAIFNQGGTFYNAYVNNQWQQVAAYTPTYMQIGATVSGKYNVRIDASGTAANNGFFVRNGTTNLSKWTSGSIVFYDGTSNQYELAKFDTSGLTLRNNTNQILATFAGTGTDFYVNNLKTLTLSASGDGTYYYGRLGLIDPSDGVTTVGTLGFRNDSDGERYVWLGASHSSYDYCTMSMYANRWSNNLGYWRITSSGGTSSSNQKDVSINLSPTSFVVGCTEGGSSVALNALTLDKNGMYMNSGTNVFTVNTSGVVNASGGYQKHSNEYIALASFTNSSVAIPGTGDSGDSYQTVEVNVTKSGYNLVGVISYNFTNRPDSETGRNASQCSCYGVSYETNVLDGSTYKDFAYVKIRNHASNSARIKVGVRCIYIAK